MHKRIGEEGGVFKSWCIGYYGELEAERRYYGYSIYKIGLSHQFTYLKPSTNELINVNRKKK